MPPLRQRGEVRDGRVREKEEGGLRVQFKN